MHTTQEIELVIGRAVDMDKAFFAFSRKRTYERPAVPGELCVPTCTCMEGLVPVVRVTRLRPSSGCGRSSPTG